MPAQIDSIYSSIAPISVIIKRYISWFIEGRPLTTRFRWLNIFTRAALSALIFLGRFVSPKVKVVHLIGLGRSGTTYLGKVLSLMNSTVFLNEPKLAWKFAWNEDDIVGSYSNRGFYRSHLEGAAARYEILLRFYRMVSWLMRSSIIVDKYPEVIFRIRHLYPFFSKDTVLVYAHRDWRDVINSIPKWNKNHALGNADWWGLNDRKWSRIVQELILESDYNLKKYSDSDNDMIRALIEWILTTEEYLRLVDFGFDIKLFSFAHPRKTLETIFLNFDENSDSLAWKYFEDSFMNITYHEIDVPSDLTQIANKLNSKVLHIISNY